MIGIFHSLFILELKRAGKNKCDCKQMFLKINHLRRQNIIKRETEIYKEMARRCHFLLNHLTLSTMLVILQTI